MQKLLGYIEDMVGGEFSEDMEWKLGAGRKFTQEEARHMAEIIDAVYRAVHASNKENECYYIHENWRKEVEKYELPN